MVKTIFSLIKNPRQTEQVIEQLRSAGFEPNNISVLFIQEEIKGQQANTRPEANVKGKSNTKTNSKYGKNISELQNVTDLNIPGLGTCVLAGPVVQTLKNAASNPTQIPNLLSKIGLTESQARELLDFVRKNHFVLVAVHGEDLETVKDIFEDNNATKITYSQEAAGTSGGTQKKSMW